MTAAPTAVLGTGQADAFPEVQQGLQNISRLSGDLSIKDCEVTMEVAIKAGAVKPVECPLVHNFFPGLYARQITIPKRTLVTSRTHKTTHPFVILSGDISVRDEDGNTIRLKAGYFGVTKPGTKRILYAHEDTEWVTFHATDETDPDVIAEQILEPEDMSRFSAPDLAMLWKHNPERDRVLRFGPVKGVTKCLLES